MLELIEEGKLQEPRQHGTTHYSISGFRVCSIVPVRSYSFRWCGHFPQHTTIVMEKGVISEK